MTKSSNFIFLTVELLTKGDYFWFSLFKHMHCCLFYVTHTHTKHMRPINMQMRHFCKSFQKTQSFITFSIVYNFVLLILLFFPLWGKQQPEQIIIQIILANRLDILFFAKSRECSFFPKRKTESQSQLFAGQAKELICPASLVFFFLESLAGRPFCCRPCVALTDGLNVGPLTSSLYISSISCQYSF